MKIILALNNFTSNRYNLLSGSRADLNHEARRAESYHHQCLIIDALSSLCSHFCADDTVSDSFTVSDTFFKGISLPARFSPKGPETCRSKSPLRGISIIFIRYFLYTFSNFLCKPAHLRPFCWFHITLKKSVICRWPS